VRVVFAVVESGAGPAVDSDLYREIARNLAAGHGYAAIGSEGRLAATARHPPVFSLVLSALDQVGLQTKLQQRVVLGLVAAIGVVLTGVVARRLGGPTAGALAAALAAVHPLWLQHAGYGVSESVYLVVVPLVLLCGLRFADGPSPGRAALLGLVVGIAALTRSEGVLFLLALVLPLAALARSPWRTRALHGLVAALAAGLVLLPWLARNDAELGGLTLSTNGGATLAGSWCESTFTEFLGGWNLYCFLPTYAEVHAEPPPRGDEWDELSLDRALTDRAIDFGRAHLDRVPQVVAARLGRTTGFYAPIEELDFDEAEGRHRAIQGAGMVLHLLLLPLAALGLTRVAPRHRVVVVAGPAIALVISAVFYGSTRMRVPAEPALVALSAIGLLVLLRRPVGPWGDGTGAPRSEGPGGI
jgi:4-amino-4-deoxy-L-arabinose transferase-like glycosyltransferase